MRAVVGKWGGAPAGVLVILAGLMTPVEAQELSRFEVGGSSASWVDGGRGIAPTVLTRAYTGNWGRTVEDTTNTPGDAIDFQHRSGWLTPRYFDTESNIASRVLEGEGRVMAEHVFFGGEVPFQLEGMVNGDHTVAFERKPTPLEPSLTVRNVWLVLDFASPVGIHRIRFYPRNTVVSSSQYPFESDFLRGYEVWVNATLTSDATPDLLVAREPRNERAVVDIEIPPQYARLVKVRSLAALPFEIDEIEVYGAGYMDRALYLSDIIDLGKPATIGPVHWTEAVDGDSLFSRLDARVRTGWDRSPILYREIVRDSRGVPVRTADVTATRYYLLDRFDRAPLIDDEENWSSWKTQRSGELTAAPVPARFVQFQLAFEGDMDAARQVRRLWFDYVTPPLADTLWAEIYPRQTEAEQPATFRYAVRLRGGGDAAGYDRLTVDTPVRAEQVRGVRLNGQPVAFAVEPVGGTGLSLRLPLIETDGDILELTFDLPIFRYGTTFSGRVWNSEFPTAPQALRPGNATSFGPDDVAELSSLFVAIPEKQIGRLVGRIDLSSPVLTPNGDSANDEVDLTCNLLQLTVPAPVELEVCDLAGRTVRTIASVDRGVGPVTWSWDGRDDSGELVNPGIYVWSLRVKADAFTERHAGTVAVAY